MSASTEWPDNSGTKRDTGTERPSNGTQIKWLIENSQNTPFSKIKYYWCFVLPLLPERPVLIDDQSRFQPLEPWQRTKHVSLPEGESWGWKHYTEIGGESVRIYFPFLVGSRWLFLSHTHSEKTLLDLQDQSYQTNDFSLNNLKIF